MRELRFHRALYAEAAVTEAFDTFARFASLERGDDGDYLVVRVAADSPARERRVAGELGNYALGVAIRDLGASS